MSFYDTIAKIFQNFMNENNIIYQQLMNELFNIECDINKLCNMKKNNKNTMEAIDIIFSKHMLNSNIYNIHESKFRELKQCICDAYKSQNMFNSKYYDELIKINNYNIED
jgi:hypothetical protein